MPKLTIGDTQIHYHVHGEGEPVLLIAGLASDLSTWKKALPKLGKHHQVIVIDNRGSGLTETSAAAFSMATLGDDAALLLQALHIKKAHVVGWSMGGNVAQELALRHPEKVGGLVLMSTYMKEPERSRFALDVMIHSVREGASMESYMMMMRAWCSTNHAFKDRHACWTQESRGDSPLSIEGFARQKQALDDFDTRKRASSIALPTLVVHGTDDIMVPIEFGQDLAAQIHGSKFHRVAGAGHFLPTSGWLDPVLDFLDEYPLVG
jgi:3-oxoadipate enol-lactonase